MKKMVGQSILVFAGALFIFFIASCKRHLEMTLEEIESYKASLSDNIISKTINKAYKGEPFVAGHSGGVWNDAITADPKSFNLLIAERDGSTSGILSHTVDSLVDYDYIKKQWIPRLASFEIKIDEKNDKLDLIYTLRDDIYWTFFNDLKPRVKLTSDDVIFWYDEIYGDEECASSAYNSRFMEMRDGTTGEITIEKIDERRFAFHFPRIVAEPLLATNMSFGPAFIYKKAKQEGGVKAVKALFSVATDLKTLPSCGRYFLTEYTPGQRLVYQKNPDFWERDEKNNSIVYPETMVCHIIGDNNTSYLLFKQEKLEDYSPTPEQLEELVRNSNNYGEKGYSVFAAAGSLGASFWTFNQNPKNKSSSYYEWFTKKQFRQAMSCLLNRERIINQTYRGLAESKYTFFPEPNKFFNADIILRYRYNQEQAKRLLESVGFYQKSDGFLYDESGIRVEFDLTISSDNQILSDIALIIADECKKIGITVNIRQTDFQKLVEQLTSSYDWQSLIIGFGGGLIFPTQGSNVWVSSGNLHVWYPLQKTPATDWERRIDFLYNEASCIVDERKAKPLWDEYQSIILEQCPLIYLVRSRSFYAINNRWDLTNVYYDNMGGAQTSHVFLRQN
ncbi:ABC transporter substrate-binding protein [Treponema pectinovorum]|uniref:ABC transporter substrate-binding protein n=1 Tax=Treponema pectinovorum TaxID=164 RepID=UPI0011F3D6C2|nr:ABC transporter substrate-binding protein [Treponema pectinovorum]